MSKSQTSSCFKVAREGRIVHLTFDRPEKRHALNEQLLNEMFELLDGLRKDGTVPIVVLSGSGNTFSAGADLTVLKAATAAEKTKPIQPGGNSIIAELVARVMSVIVSGDIIVIAAVNGHAIGGGWMLAMGCDFQIASRDARFWFPEVGLGRSVSAPSAAGVHAIAGPLLAKEILTTGRRYTADELFQLHLLNRVVAPDMVASAALEFAQELARINPKSFAVTKQRINSHALAKIWP